MILVQQSLLFPSLEALTRISEKHVAMRVRKFLFRLTPEAVYLYRLRLTRRRSSYFYFIAFAFF